MPSPELAKALSDLGGFALFLFTVIAAVVGLLKQWVVPGWVYKQEREARIAAETQAERNAEALATLAASAKRDQRRRVPPREG